MSMTITDYEARRHELEQQMQKIGDREGEFMMELSIRFQAECKRIQSQIGNLKKKQKDLTANYRNDRQFTHRKYRAEKLAVTEKIHLLRLQYLTENGQGKGGEA